MDHVATATNRLAKFRWELELGSFLFRQTLRGYLCALFPPRTDSSDKITSINHSRAEESIFPSMSSLNFNHPRFMTAEEAGKFLGGAHPRTVARWAREGYLPAYPIGEGKRKFWRFLESDLYEWMLSRKHGHPSNRE